MSGHPNTVEEQRGRLLARLRSAPLTTLDARGELDVMHPAARVMELRRAGYCIETVTVEKPSPCGQIHRVAQYVLVSPSGDDYSLPLPFPTSRPTARKAAS